ncbi:hypothetical protein RZS08_66775, partial [Arthrospira platensis SPKY1]|nr:hypothetical protein [Arthrospira platensis SPKY1]
FCSKIKAMTESNFFRAVKFTEFDNGYFAQYEDGLSKTKWIGQGRTKAEAFDDLIEEILRNARIGIKH